MSRHQLSLDSGTITEVESHTVYFVALDDGRRVRCTLRHGIKRIMGLLPLGLGSRVEVYVMVNQPDCGRIHDFH